MQYIFTHPCINTSDFHYLATSMLSLCIEHMLPTTHTHTHSQTYITHTDRPHNIHPRETAHTTHTQRPPHKHTHTHTHTHNQPHTHTHTQPTPHTHTHTT